MLLLRIVAALKAQINKRPNNDIFGINELSSLQLYDSYSGTAELHMFISDVAHVGQ